MSASFATGITGDRRTSQFPALVKTFPEARRQISVCVWTTSLRGALHYAKTENGNGFTVTAGQGQTENGIIFWTNRNAGLCITAKTENGNGFAQ